MGRARGAADAVDGCCDVDASAVACAGGASLAATGGACCIDAFSPAAGEAAELEAAEATFEGREAARAWAVLAEEAAPTKDADGDKQQPSTPRRRLSEAKAQDAALWGGTGPSG